jgi:spore germination cell wall hydrolase CwlJ-like protein
MEETNMHAVQNFVDKHHDFILKVGGLFVFIFFAIYIPMSSHIKARDTLEHQLIVNAHLAQEMSHMNDEMALYQLSYEKHKELIKEVECLARNIYFEAGGESYVGKVAVAEVTLNRVKSSSYPKTVCDVVYQKTKGVCQFSWVCESKKPVNVRAENWIESMRISEQMLVSKKQTNVVGGAKFFHAHYVEPSWSRTKTFVRKIGNHLFYEN